MRRIEWEELCFFLVVIGLIALWVFVQVSGFPRRTDKPANCRILDIVLEPSPDLPADGRTCRVVIRLNECVDYRMRRDEDGHQVRLELPCARMAEGVADAALSNELVRDVWVRPCQKGRLTVGLNLDSRHIRVSSPLLRVGEHWEIVIELKRPSLHDVPLPAAVPEGLRMA